MSVHQQSLSLEQQIEELTNLLHHLRQASTLDAQLTILDRLPLVQEYLKQHPFLLSLLRNLSPQDSFIVKSIIAIRQAPFVFYIPEDLADRDNLLISLLGQLRELEHFYKKEGGIIGYHLALLSLLAKQKEVSAPPSSTRYIHPAGVNIDEDGDEVRQYIRWGLEFFESTGEIYPVGGAGDRLSLIDEKTGTALPAALLLFAGKTLLEGLIRDVQAREYLYFKLYHKRILTPLALMTSEEKNNHNHILNIFESQNWFGRSPENFFFFKQPLVPVVTKEGNWSLSAPLKLTLKPGGHGVIWKLADEQGAFDWLLKHKRTKALVRQINNPLAGTDQTLLTLTGLGCKQNKVLGFASCERVLNSAEGVDIVIEKKTEQGFEYCLTNIEYTDFAQKGIDETPSKAGSPFSIFPANTNILFIDIAAIREISRRNPIPGQLINLKSKVSFIDQNGETSQVEGGRLESTMQNIADYISDTFKQPLQGEGIKKQLKTFITYGKRVKTLSTTKKLYKPGDSFLSTPEQAFYDMLFNNWDLLKNYCHFDMPQFPSIEQYLQEGPSFLVTHHPALGPLYSVIAQKIRNGKIGPKSELHIEVAEVNIQDLDLEGSLLIESQDPLGLKGKESRCLLHNVKVRNRGTLQPHKEPLWKKQIHRQEELRIELGVSSEFEAQSVTFEGSYLFRVPDHHRLKVYQDKQGKLIQEQTAIQKPSWQWKYTFDDQNHIQLTLL